MHWLRPRAALPAALATSALLLAGCAEDAGASADGSWQPTEPIEYVAPADTGGGWDTLARTSARVLEGEELVSQPLRVINKPGAGGAIGWAYVAGHPGDAHKLFVTSPPILLVPLAGQSDFGHDDFTPIARLNSEPLAYLVKSDSPYETFSDLAEDLKSRPGSVSVAGGSGPGSMDHVGLAGAAQAAGADPAELKYVPFDGGGEALTALLGGHVEAAITGASEAQALVRAGDVRVLAVSSEERVNTLPDAPTLTEEGVDYVFDVWRGVMGPADLTDEQVAYYEQAFADMIETDSWQEESERLGWTDDFAGAEEFGTFLENQNEEVTELLSDIGLAR